MALGEHEQWQIERVLREYRQRSVLSSHGLSPLRKLLLTGRPGTGKTMTAAVLAGELGLPLFTIQFDALITKFLGETAAKLRLIFEAVQETTAVYLFDEFDAIGADRTARNDLGEIRRVLNSFLQFLELDESQSLIVAATNNPQLLDRALFRRFDVVIEYGLPSPEVVDHLFRSQLALLDTKEVNWEEVVAAARGLSHADITRSSAQTLKNAILANRNAVVTGDVLGPLRERTSLNEATR
jgi:SpoVK/Ycf46/Vps4 family AAA+-type ATPase